MVYPQRTNRYLVPCDPAFAMSDAEIDDMTLHLRCDACGAAYEVPPICVDGAGRVAAYSSDKDFCVECGSGNVTAEEEAN